MEIIIAPRGSGKTLKLIKRSLKTGETVVVNTEAQKNSVMSIAKTIKADIPEPVVFTDLLHREFLNSEDMDPYEKGLLLDNVGDMLRSLFRCNIKSITLNEEDYLNEEDNQNLLTDIR